MSYINGRSVIGIAVLFPVIGAVTVAARFYVRRNRKMTLELDDWLCLPALAFVTGCAVSLIVGSAGHAIGYHSGPKDNAANDKKIVFLEKCEFAFNIMSPLALGSIKLSILFLYRRIFRGRIFDILSWTLITLVVLWTLGFFLVQVFDCRSHFYVNWGPLADLEKCLSSFKQLLAYSVSDVIIDIFILVLPLPLIWMLHMPRERKLAVSGIFLLGTLAVIAGILRMVVFAEILGAGHVQVVLHILGVIVLDDMAVVSLILFWPMIELGVALIAACLPTLAPLFHDVSLESVVRSVRGKLSLNSLRNRSKSTLAQVDIARRSNDSTSTFAPKNVVTTAHFEGDEYSETHAMNFIRTKRSENQFNLHEINVRNELTQAVEQV